MSSSLLFSTHSSGGQFKKNLKKGSYTIKLEGLSDRITWFTDIPDRQAGNEHIEDFIGGWSSGFPDGVNPNAALEFTDKNGESDVVVFEMFRPVYNSKRDTLKFRAKINDSQVLDGALESHSVRADEKFTKEFSDSSLFIDNWFLKDTQLTIKNNLTENVLLRPITFDKDGRTASDYFWDAIGGGIGFDAVIGSAVIQAGAAAIAAEGPFAIAFGAIVAAEAVPVLLAASAVAGVGIAIADAVQTNYHTVVDNTSTPEVIKPGESFTIRDSESKWGFHNGVADIAFLVTTEPKVDPVTGVKSGGIIGSVFYDNPAVGSTYAKIVSGINPVPESLNDVDRIVLDSGESRRIDFPGGHMTTTYDESSGFLAWGSKDWTLDIFAN